MIKKIGLINFKTIINKYLLLKKIRLLHLTHQLPNVNDFSIHTELNLFSHLSSIFEFYFFFHSQSVSFGQQCAFNCSQVAYNAGVPYESTCIMAAEATWETQVGTNICCLTVCVTANSFPQLTLGEGLFVVRDCITSF